MTRKRQNKLDSTEYDLMHDSIPPFFFFFLLFLTPYSLGQKPWLHLSAKSCHLCSFGSHIKTPAAHRPLSSHLLQENISLQKWGGLRWPSVKRVIGAKQVSKCDKSCWASCSQVAFVHSHLRTKEALCHKRQSCVGGYGWFNNSTVVFSWN